MDIVLQYTGEEMDEKNEEIERLYDEMDSMANDELEAACEIRSLKAEIERLRKTGSIMEKFDRDKCAQIDAKDAEIERLKGLLDIRVAVIENLRSRLDAAVEWTDEEKQRIWDCVDSLPIDDRIIAKLRGES